MPPCLYRQFLEFRKWLRALSAYNDLHSVRAVINLLVLIGL